ncbi:LytTR family DNA-binding domain-containing protein [Urechidicola sp. KH5]
MKIIIFEDEIAASDNLTYMLQAIDPSIEIVKVLASVADAVTYFEGIYKADLITMDIHLADGLSFEIFEKVKIDIPVIFTTAYDQYAIKAFKVNSIDYLLKPIDEDELREALQKFKNSRDKIDSNTVSNQMQGLIDMLQSQQKPAYKTTYLVHHRDELLPLKTDNIAYFYIDLGMVKAVSKENQTFILDKKLEDIEAELPPEIFFRANRQFILNKAAISNIKFYFNGKLIVNTKPPSKERIVVSKAKATLFKTWVDS